MKKKPMTRDEAIQILRKCDKTIKRRHRYFCGLTELMDEYKSGDFFFESPDGQNGELYYELCRNGFQNAGHAAEYYWKVRNGRTYITYTEGDVSVYVKEL